MTHLTLDELLALREPGLEPGVAAASAHLKDCAACRAELERLHQRIARFKALPTLRPTRDRWPQVAARLKAERRQRRVRRTGVAGLALAASVAMAVVIGDISAPTEASASEEINAVMERSRALESAIDRYDPEARVLDGRTARITSELEDRIASLDRELEMAELMGPAAGQEELLRLWRERVGLLDALVDVHVTRASNVGL